MSLQPKTHAIKGKSAFQKKKDCEKFSDRIVVTLKKEHKILIKEKCKGLKTTPSKLIRDLLFKELFNA